MSSREQGLLGLFAGMLLAIPTFGQIGGTGAIRGVVSDPSGAVIPAATVVATNVGTQVKTTGRTTEAGVYSISPLPAGDYTVTVSANGFQTLVQEHVTVDALATVGLNLTLKLGSANEQVTVVDRPPQLDTLDARIGQTMPDDVYMALPLFMGNAPRDPTQFVSLEPGVPTNTGTYEFGDVSGAQGNSGEMYVEGMPLTNPAIQGEVRNVLLGVSAEGVSEFQLETAGSPAMYNGQGSANFVLKSGTNHFHGAVYEYFRNTDLDARSFFASSRPIEHQNEFGENVAGPIVRNRIFFFQSFDEFRYLTGNNSSFYTIAPLAERGGDFSAYPAVIYDPQSLNCLGGPCSRQAFPGNIIPANRISPISKFLESTLPQPTNGNLTNNYQGSSVYGFNNYGTTQKVDFNASDKHRFLVLYSRGRRAQANDTRGATLPKPYGSGSSALVVDEVVTTAQARYTYIATPTLVNQLSYGISRFFQPQINNTQSGDYAEKAGIKGLPPGGASLEFPSVTFSGPNSPTSWGGAHPVNEVDQSFTLQDNVQWTKGRHSFTFGGQMQWEQINYANNAFGSQANWTFSNAQTEGFNASGTPVTTTGNSWASFLLGGLSSASLQDDFVTKTGGRYKDYSFWATDNFKPLPRLSLNLGLRYDLMTPFVEVKNRMSFFNPSLPNPAASGYPGILQFAGNGPDSCGCRQNVSTYYKGFQPRIGLAYSINAKTVFRAGYDMTYTHRGAVGGRGNARQGTGVLGFSANPSWTSLDTYSPAFYWDAGVPSYVRAPFFDPTLNTGFTTTTPQGGSVTYGDPQIGGHPPRYQNWSAGIQRAVRSTLTVTVSYVGTNGHYLQGGTRGLWGDQILPQDLALKNLLTASATSANIAAANAIIPGIHLPYANYAGSISQMLRPFPQYNSVADAWGEVGNSNYNSLQAIAVKTLSHGLVLNANYTFAKGLDDLGTRNNYSKEKAQTTISPQIVHVILVYQLPFGKGQPFGSGSRLVNALAGGWQLSGITTFNEGGGFGAIGGSCNLPNAGSCYVDLNPNFSGPVRIGGNPADANLRASTPPVFLDKNAFQNPTAYTFGNSPRTMVYKLRTSNSFNQSLSLRREFGLRERMKLLFQADVSNPTNIVIFGTPSTSFNSTNFGTITSASAPRVVQFNARITF
jgi:hypothetical protein